MTEKNMDYEELGTLPLFDGIEQEEIKTMLPCLKTVRVRYEKNRFIIIDSDKVPYVGLILRGTVHMMKEDVWGNQSLMASMGKGSLMGESFALGQGTSYVSFRAAEDTEILRMPLEKVLYTCNTACPFHRRIVRNTFSLLAGKNVQLMKKIEITSKATLRQKILCYLSQLSEEQDSKTIIVPLNRTEMAAYLGSNRSAMSRELKAMQDDGVIQIRGNRFTVQ